MRTKVGPIATLWSSEDAMRERILERARHCARLTDPSILPPKEQEPESRLPENFQSIGANGITTLEGKILMAVFPPDTPWIHIDVASDILFEPGISAADIQAAQQVLFLRGLHMQAMLESAEISGRYRSPDGFRTNMRQAIAQVLVTGDALLRLDDQYRVTVFRRDEYVTRRNQAGEVLYHIVRESIDPLTLSEAQIAKAGLYRDKLRGMPVAERMMDLYTKCEWDPIDNVWKTEQELNGVTINSSTDPVPAYFAVYFKLVQKEHYGRGFIETRCRGDLHSLDTLSQLLLDFAGASAKVTPCIDMGSEVKPEDLMRPSGVPIPNARVVGGVVQDVGFLKIDKLQDFTVCANHAAKIEQRLGQIMLIGSASVRDSERTTKFEIQSITVEQLEGALGGFYAPMADLLQKPLGMRLHYQMERDKLLRPLPKESIRVEYLTGIAALARLQKFGKIMSMAELIRGLGEKAMARLNEDVLIDVAMRYAGIHEPGIVKTAAERDAEVRAALRAQAQSQAIEQGIKSAGAIAEAHLSPTGTAQ